MPRITPADNLERDISMVCEALVREIGRATRWCAVVDAWEALLHVRHMGEEMVAEIRRHDQPAAAQGTRDG